jgi:sporulation protein YlmC with PRC-barrel domain
MTMQARELIGAQVTSADGQVVGTVEQVFNADADGQPVWARVRAGKRNRFVPLGGGRMAAGGLSVPFEAQKIISGPEISAEQHMSAAQADQLTRHYGRTAPTQPQAGPQDRRAQLPEDERLVRNEEWMNARTEVPESGRVSIHKYVDTEPAVQAVYVFHEE